MLPTSSTPRSYPRQASESRRFPRQFPVWTIPTAGAAMLLVLAVAFLAVPPPVPAPSAAAHLATSPTLAAVPAIPTAPMPDDDWLEESFLLRPDESGAATVRPEGDLVLAAQGGGMEARVQNGELSVTPTHDGGWRVRALHPGVRGEIAVWCGKELYSLRVRADAAAPLHRRLWLVPPPPVAAGGSTGAGDGGASSDPDAEAATRAMLDELVNLEGQGPTGKGAGDYGTGELEGVLTHWRRALRHGNVCGAVVEITNRRTEPFFFEPMSLAVGLPGRGTPEILARSSEGLILPGKTQPAVVIWYDPLPPGAVAADPQAAQTPPAGPYVLRFHPWPLPWHDLAALATPTPTPAAVAATPSSTSKSKRR